MVRRSHLAGKVCAAARTPFALAALLLAAVPQAAVAQIVVSGPVDGAGIGPGVDIEMDGGTLFFNTDRVLNTNHVLFAAGTTGTITAAAGKTLEFTGGNLFIMDPASTAVFGSATATGRVEINDTFVLPSIDGAVVVAGGTLASNTGAIYDLIFFSDSTTVHAGATIDLRDAGPFGAIHNLKGAGNVVTAPGSLFQLWGDPGATTEFSGVISGGAELMVMNTGFGPPDSTIVLSGNNTYTGGTTICFCSVLQLGNGGTSGSIVGDVINGGTLVFNRSNTYAFDGVISDDFLDAGKVVQAGTGTTVLTAIHTYTGATTVAAGKLVVNGSIAASDTTVRAGAVLGGTGTLGATHIEAGGTHAPGNSIGTQTVVGPYALAAGAVLEVEIDSAGASDRVVVAGTVSLTGAVLRVLAAGGGQYVPNTAYLIVDNDGADAVTGGFGQVASNLVFLAPEISYAGGTGNDVVMTLRRNATALASVARTPGQTRVANAVNQLPDDDPLVIAIVNQDADGARTAFDALSGEVHATLGGFMIEDSRFVREAVLARLAQAFYAGNAAGAAIASGAPVVAMVGEGSRMALGRGERDATAPPRAASGLAFWTHAYGAWADADAGAEGVAAATRTLGGFVSGMDAALGGSWRVGVATGYEQARVAVGARESEADAERYHLAAYAGGGLGPLALRAGASWTWHDIETERTIAFPGFRTRTDASYDGDTGQVFGEAALPIAGGRTVLEPYAGLAYVHVETDAIRETGSPGALRSGGFAEEVTFATLGLRAATALEVGGLTLSPRVAAAWRHAFDDTVPGLVVAFAAGGGGFAAEGVPIAEDAALIEAGLDVHLGAEARIGVSYIGQLADEVEDHGVKGVLLWPF